MAYLGFGGIIQFHRERPRPIVIPSSAVNKALGFVTTDFDDWMLGELVSLVHENGAISGYIHKDELSRIYFHLDLYGGLSNNSTTLIPLGTLPDVDVFALCTSPTLQQLETVSEFLLGVAPPSYEMPIRAWPALSEEYDQNEAPVDWFIQGGLESWSLSIGGQESDTSAIGEQYSSSIKAAISGSGSLDFLVDKNSDPGYGSPEHLIKMAQIVGPGATAQARFILNGNSTGDAESPFIYYYANILITTCAINTRKDDVIRGTVNFVSNGPIRLLSSADLPQIA